MSDGSEGPRGLAQEIGDSLATVWKNHCGARPASQPRIEINSDVIRCMLDGAVADFDSGVSAIATDGEVERAPRRPTYRLDAIAAIGRVTKRRVLAFVSNHDAKTDLATEVFILDRPLGRSAREYPDHRRAPARSEEW